MLLNDMLFYLFAAIAVASAIAMVTRRDMLHAAVCLGVTLLATAGIFLQLQAEFLFAAQIFIFMGGIAVLFLLAILLMASGATPRKGASNRRTLAATALALVLGAQLCFAFWTERRELFPTTSLMPPANTQAVGAALFQHYALPFEMTSILLLVAMIGAVVVIRRGVS